MAVFLCHLIWLLWRPSG